MTDRSADRARACFRLAAAPSATEGERAAALNRGMAILERAGLDPDHFDIPGRERKARNPYANGGEGFQRYTRFHEHGGAPSWADAWEGMPVFTMDELVREAVREAIRHRAWAAMNQAADAARKRERGAGRPCSGGCGRTILYGTICTDCAWG